MTAVRVLVVDDEPDLRALVSDYLEMQGYAIGAAANAAELDARLAEAPADVIVLDINMPGENGLAALARIRAAGCRSGVILLTAAGNLEDRLTGLTEGADDYLVKPFAFQELLARMRALLRRRGEPKTARLQVGDLILDTLSRQASRGGRIAELSAREYALLEFLMRHPGQVLGRTQIMDHVWGYDFVAASNVVDVYIGYLRRKIDDGFERKLIHTVRGAGYKIDPGS